MPEHVVIDGNNLLYAMREHAPIPTVGRETMVRIIDRWARQGHDRVTLILDGPPPREGLSQQMTSSRITVRFSAPATADDLIVQMIHGAANPDDLRVVTADTAIVKEASRRRTRSTLPIDFIAELFPSDQGPAPPQKPQGEKPSAVSEDEARELLDLLGEDDLDEPFPGADRMKW